MLYFALNTVKNFKAVNPFCKFTIIKLNLEIQGMKSCLRGQG